MVAGLREHMQPEGSPQMTTSQSDHSGDPEKGLLDALVVNCSSDIQARFHIVGIAREYYAKISVMSVDR